MKETLRSYLGPLLSTIVRRTHQITKEAERLRRRLGEDPIHLGD